jgi:outer membrane protein OmpA-like peptidoglycan-associated protein
MPDAMNKYSSQKPVFGLFAGQQRFAAVVGCVLAIVVAIGASGLAQAQSTVIVGGSGKSSVEVNLDTLEPISGNTSPYGRILKMPGTKSLNSDAPITLRMPGGTTGSGSVARVPRLKLTRPTRQSLQVANRKPALPSARVVTQPQTIIARVAVPAPTAVPLVKPAAPKVISRTVAKAAPMPAAKPAPMPPKKAMSKPVPKPVQMAKKSPAAAPPPPPPPAPKVMTPIEVKPRVVKPAPVPVAAKLVVPQPVVQAPIVPAAPKAVQKEQKIASLPRKVNVSTPGLAMRVGFSGNSTRISADEKFRLNAFATKMADGDDRLQLKSFAGGSGETPSASRRRSLSRALAVRSYLIGKGFRSTRIDVRALGMSADQGPSDRVDVIILVR